MNLAKKAFFLTFGVLALLFGISIIGWVLYNELIEKQPSFQRPPLLGTFGVAPALSFVGYNWIRRVFRSEESSP